MEASDDDILEHALNFGIESSSTRFKCSKERVIEIVRSFAKEIDTPCSCERAYLDTGNAYMCFMCDKFSRINI